jgi:hypothetical protein
MQLVTTQRRHPDANIFLFEVWARLEVDAEERALLDSHGAAPLVRLLLIELPGADPAQLLASFCSETGLIFHRDDPRELPGVQDALVAALRDLWPFWQAAAGFEQAVSRRVQIARP